ncbi:methylated-DNA--[protein]-cysteine S-methyltransferase [Carnobacterium funditum]|uniref:methylated-DNA--[protein]-cysteine S-methyltransferase n=1 Tax=Carnobacterium funditum TaxID=2752 RepID=UPI000553FA15|nr:methylated-DNA--[protein]-cysteine S-methyltransferase [Carnobacterium funditum]
MNKEDEFIYYGRIPNPDWPIYIAVTEKGLCFVGSLGEDEKELVDWIKKMKSTVIFEENWSKVVSYATQLEEYFKGERISFDMAIDVKGTVFQKKVWSGLSEIPYGETITYGGLAEKIGYPSSFRAVGTAVGKNPLLIIVPCHRVVHKNGQISGYRGPIAMKTNLLALERLK